MSSISEGSFEFSDSDEESKIATPIIRPMAKLAAPDDAGVDYFFITDSDTRSHSTHDIHLSLNGMTPSVTSAALTERSGTSSHGIKLHKTQGEHSNITPLITPIRPRRGGISCFAEQQRH